MYPLVFPIAGGGHIGSPFGAPRDGGSRSHLGNDIAAPALQPVVAAAAGTVSRIAGDTGISGYRVHIAHDDGWSTLYIHLNNDTAGTDDGSGFGIRPDLKEGDRVQAGEVIGWNGDSGNAETTEPHLHFELRNPAGDSVDPRASLEQARQQYPSFSGPFQDLNEENHALALLLSRGVDVWCADPTQACPDETITTDQAHSWVTRLAGPVAPGCESDCEPATELDLVRLLAAALTGEESSDLSPIEAFTALDGAARCMDLPDHRSSLTRAEAAEALVTWLGWDPQTSCPRSTSNR